jgi:hypothetical protein
MRDGENACALPHALVVDNVYKRWKCKDVAYRQKKSDCFSALKPKIVNA